MLSNSVAPDQTPLSVASDLGLQCLPMSNKSVPGVFELNNDNSVL